MMGRKDIGRVILALLWAGFMGTACAPTIRAHLDRTYEGDIVFPPPPAPPRVEFMMSIYEVLPSGKTLMDVLAGPLRSDPAYLPIFPGPAGLYVREDTLYLVDNTLPRITRIDLSTGAVRHFGFQQDHAQGCPVDIVVDKDGRAYVTDSEVSRVFVYGPDGEFERFLTREGTFKRPTGIAIDEEDDHLYIADTLDHNIKVFDLKGRLLRVIGRRGEDPGEFNYPVYLAFRHKRLYVLDVMNFRVQVLSPDGRVLEVFGHHGDTYADLQMPKGIGVDTSGNIYIADAIQDMVKIYDPHGRLLLFFGESGRRLGQFSMPFDLYVDRKDRIFVSDRANMRVQVFRLLKGGEKG